MFSINFCIKYIFEQNYECFDCFIFYCEVKEFLITDVGQFTEQNS